MGLSFGWVPGGACGSSVVLRKYEIKGIIMKLSVISEDYDPNTNWEDYVKSSGYTVESLNKLYHGTSKNNIGSIMLSGLDPNRSDPAHIEDEIDNDFDNLGPPYAFVYLSIYPKLSLEFAPGGDYNSADPRSAALLEITLPNDLKKQLILDRGEFIRAPFVIPPKYISIVSEL